MSYNQSRILQDETRQAFEPAPTLDQDDIMSSAANLSMTSIQKTTSAEVNHLEDELNRRYAEQAAEIGSLRELNSALLERLKEFKNRDAGRVSLEERCRAQEAEIMRLREVERSLRGLQSSRSDEQSDLNRNLDMAQSELASMQKAIADRESVYAQFKNDLSRKLAKLTDDNWSKDLEIESLRNACAVELEKATRLNDECMSLQKRLNEATEQQTNLQKLVIDQENDLRSQREENARNMQSVEQAYQHQLETLKAELASLQAAMSEQTAQSQARISQLEREHAEQTEEIIQANEVMTELEQALENGKNDLLKVKEHASQTLQNMSQQHAEQVCLLRSREGQLNSDISKLQEDNESLQNLLTAANETVVELRTTLDSERAERIAERAQFEQLSKQHLADLQARLQADFQVRFDSVMQENTTMRQSLEVRDNTNEQERQSLKHWQEQLNYLDQHLSQSRDLLKKDKAEIMRMAKQLVTELQMALNHPFNDYLELTEVELSRLQAQYNSASALSPVRQKMEERLAQMIEQRDFLKSVVESSRVRLEERIQAVQTITKNSGNLL